MFGSTKDDEAVVRLLVATIIAHAMVQKYGANHEEFIADKSYELADKMIDKGTPK